MAHGIPKRNGSKVHYVLLLKLVSTSVINILKVSNVSIVSKVRNVIDVSYYYR